ncbi:MAG: transporter substrate-binding domain-containing protein [Pantoea sp.]|uniref:hybrid sensor histidine kinase/response regulator n=2 Tax=Pantoea sp. TaxID=69393 RepID=UPI00238FD534|nr:ATP-binding protein [Pantoea sp.]MDE1188340.1 transporter substrate-binding domain-containing protein [Pantoea sp.]
MRRWLLLLTLLCSTLAQADLQPASSVMLPAMMPAPHSSPWPTSPLRAAVPAQNSAPWAMRIGDQIWGIDADYLSALSQLTGNHFVLESYPDLSQQLAALARGEVDLVLSTEHAALSPAIGLSDSWYSSPVRIYRNRDNQRAVMFNSHNAQLTVAQSTLDQLPDNFVRAHRWHSLPGDLQALYALFNQQSDYLVADEASAGFLLSQLQQGQIYQITADPGAGDITLRAMARDPALIQWLNQQLRLLPAEFSNRVRQRWSPPLLRYQDTQTLMLSPAEQQWLAQHREIPYAAEADNAPWSYRDASGNARGFAIDLLNALSQSTGLRFTPRWVANPQQAATLLQQQQVMLSVLPPLDGATTLPVWRAIWGIYTLTAHQPMNWQGLQGQRVGILRADLAQRMLPAGVTPQIFDDRGQLWQALNSGQIDALVDNVLSARWRIASHYGDRIHLAFAASDIAWPLAPEISAQQPVLRALLDRALQQIPPETLSQMRDNWSMPPQPGTTMTMRNVPLLVLIAAGIAILVLLILLVRRYLQQRRERLQREQAERANAAKSQFLATASHELRTPMQAILGLLELEQELHPSPRLELMHSSARSLMALLNDLQDHARIESHSFRLSPRPIDLAHWLQQQQQFYHPLMRDAGPQLVVEALTTLPAAVLLDGDRLQQVVNNLVANALKFTRAGDIRLTLAVSNDIVLMVADCGSGIPLEEQAQLFEPWYQAPSGKTHAVQGSGLGLFICREIVQRMGGTLTLTSAPGVGTTVQVTLPLQLADGEPEATASSWPHYPQLRVAIVDDHPTNLLVMQQQLATFAIHAEVFDNGRALLRADARQPFDVLFIDQMMPRPDGLTLLRILRRRQRQRGSAALRILCSADAQLAKQPLQPDEALLIKPITLAAIAPLLARMTHDPLSHVPDSLRILAQHNESFIPRICQTLQRTLMLDRDALLAAHEGQNWPELARAAHRMKGSWLLLGIDDIATHCQQLTDAAKQQRLEPESFDLLISLTNRLLKQLESYGTHPFSQRA